MFTSHGSYLSPQAYVNGLVPALWVGAAVLAAGALIAAVLPFSTRESASAHALEEAAIASAHAGVGASSPRIEELNVVTKDATTPGN